MVYWYWLFIQTRRKEAPGTRGRGGGFEGLELNFCFQALDLIQLLKGFRRAYKREGELISGGAYYQTKRSVSNQAT